MDMRRLQMVEEIELNNTRCFNSVNGDSNFLINFPRLKKAFRLVGMSFSDDQVKRLFEDLDADRDGLISGNEYMDCLRPKFGNERVMEAFDKADSDKVGLLSAPQAHQALLSLGVAISLADSKSLASILFGGFEGRINFSLFYRMTSYSALFMHRIVPVVEEGERAATWKEIVVSIHVVFGALATSTLGFIPKPPNTIPRTNTTIPPIKIPFVEPSTLARVVDTMTMVCLILWGGAYILAIRMRGTPRGSKCPRFLPVPYMKIMDCVSLSFGLATLCLLMSYLDPFMSFLPLIASAFVGTFLFLMRDW